MAAGLLLALWTVLPVAARDLYVGGANASDTNPGSADRPYATIQEAIYDAYPGDRILVRDGVYTERLVLTRSGEPDARIVLRSINKHGAKIDVDFDHAIEIDGKSYIDILRFEITNAFDRDYNGTGIHINDSHHIRVRSNFVHGCGGNGISATSSDTIRIENNDVYNNSLYSRWQTSGISIFKPKPHPGSRDWGIVVAGNRSWGNTHTVPRISDGKVTDGNGIIVDNTLNRTELDIDGDNVAYDRWILVENNFCWDNLGAGVTAYASTKVRFRNNSCYRNNAGNVTGQGELTVGSSADIQFINNIAIAGGDGYKVAVEYLSENVEWSHNLMNNGANHGATLWNTKWAWAGFVDPRNGDLHLKANSPAIAAGTANWGRAKKDIDGTKRPTNVLPTIGADHR